MPPAHLFQIKTPAESRHGWDLHEPVATTSAEDAAPALADERYPLVRT